jgi:hypothetical protein
MRDPRNCGDHPFTNSPYPALFPAEDGSARNFPQSLVSFCSSKPTFFLRSDVDMDELSRFIDDALGLSAATANELTVAQVGLRVLNIVLILIVRLGKKRFR